MRVARRPIAATAPMSEATFQRELVRLARDLGWGVALATWKHDAEEAAGYGVVPAPLEGLVFHPRFSVGSEPGWPDLTLVRRRDRRLIFAELKSDKGRLGDRQAAVLELLRCLERTGGPVRTAEYGGILGSYSEGEVTIEVHVWRPADLDAIGEILR